MCVWRRRGCSTKHDIRCTYVQYRSSFTWEAMITTTIIATWNHPPPIPQFSAKLSRSFHNFSRRKGKKSAQPKNPKLLQMAHRGGGGGGQYFFFFYVDLWCTWRGSNGCCSDDDDDA